VSSAILLMSDCCFGEQAFGVTLWPAREMALERWLIGEQDECVRAATVNYIVFEQREGSDSTDGEGRAESSDSDSE